MRKLPFEKDGLKKGPWTEEEDLKLIQYIRANGPGKWRSLPKYAGKYRLWLHQKSRTLIFFFSNMSIFDYNRASEMWKKLSPSMDKLLEA